MTKFKKLPFDVQKEIDIIFGAEETPRRPPLMKIQDKHCRVNLDFKINGVKASPDDFGEVTETEPADYACGNLQFDPKGPDRRVMKKYGIDEDQWETVTKELKKEIKGSCYRCE